MTLLEILREQKEHKISGQIYELTQIEMAFNSNKIEGSTISLRDAGMLYTDNITPHNSKWDEVVEMKNHFELFDYMLDTALESLSEEMIKEYHRLLKKETEDANLSWFAIGDYKKVENVVANSYTTSPDETPGAMKSLLKSYGKECKSFEDIVDFHVKFEMIHPFQDGNGRVGRMIMFKECLRSKITPIVVLDRQKRSYMNGISDYFANPKKLLRTMKKFQNQYSEQVERLAIPVSKFHNSAALDDEANTD